MEPNHEIPCIPPSSTYCSYEEAYAALWEHREKHGYGFRLKKSKPYRSDIKTHYYYCCDRQGKHQSTATVRDASSRRIDCPFKLVISKTNSAEWSIKVNHEYHNHGPSLNPKDHNVFRRRIRDQKESIESMRKAGIAPKQMLSSIKEEYPETHITILSNRSAW